VRRLPKICVQKFAKSCLPFAEFVHQKSLSSCARQKAARKWGGVVKVKI